MEFRDSKGKPITEEAVANRGFSLYEVYFPVLAQKVSTKAGNASNKKKAFEIKSIIDIMEILNKSGGKCYYTGKLFKDLNDVTFERIDPNKDYTVENTAFANQESNNIKSHLDAFEKSGAIPIEMKIKLLNKLTYRLNKQMKEAQKK